MVPLALETYQSLRRTKSKVAIGDDALIAPKLLEPPGFMALNYGHGTPVATLAGQALYGVVLGGFPQVASFFA